MPGHDCPPRNDNRDPVEYFRCAASAVGNSGPRSFNLFRRLCRSISPGLYNDNLLETDYCCRSVGRHDRRNTFIGFPTVVSASERCESVLAGSQFLGLFSAFFDHCADRGKSADCPSAPRRNIRLKILMKNSGKKIGFHLA